MVNAQNALVHNLTVNTLNTQAYPQPCWEGWSNCARARRLAFKRWWAVLWPGKSHGGALCAAVHGVAKSRTRLSDFTFTFHFSLSCTGEGNGNPLQCSCLENPRDGGAWWAAVCGVAQSRTWLKRLSSSSSSRQTPRMALQDAPL